VDTLGTAGLAYLGLAAAIVLAAMAVGFVAGQFLLRTATDDLLGVISGITGNPAILVYANKAVPSDRIDAAYATTFPALTILKILCAQIALGML
jgi:putative transport protein